MNVYVYIIAENCYNFNSFQIKNFDLSTKIQGD